MTSKPTQSGRGRGSSRIFSLRAMRERIQRWHVIIGLLGILLISPAPKVLVEALWPSADAPAVHAEPVAGAHGERERAIVVLGEKIGEALIIAVVLALFVDEAVKQLLVEEVLEDVLKFVVGVELPAEIKDRVLTLLRIPFVRRDFQIMFTLEPVPATATAPALMCVRSTTKYRVVNLTETPKVFKFTSSIEKGHLGLPQPNRIVRMTAGDVILFGEGAAYAVEAADEGNYLVNRVNVDVPGAESGGIWFQTDREAWHLPEDTLVLDILEPMCVGVAVNVFAPSTLDVKVSFGTHGPHSEERQGQVRKWSHPGVHLPGSHVRISWRATGPAAAIGPAIESAVV